LSSAGVQLLHDLAAIAPGLTLAAVPGQPAHDVLRLVGLANHIGPAAQLSTARAEHQPLDEIG